MNWTKQYSTPTFYKLRDGIYKVRSIGRDKAVVSWIDLTYEESEQSASVKTWKTSVEDVTEYFEGKHMISYKLWESYVFDVFCLL